VLENYRDFKTTFPAKNTIRVLAWLCIISTFLNVFYFVLRCSSPVIQADGWWVLDVFVRKLIDGSVALPDFFVKRNGGGDHAQPLFKLLLMLEWRYFDLDFVIDAIAGVLGATACAIILHRIVVEKRSLLSYLAWATMCALLFSLNGEGGTWTWPLVALENITTLIILLFILAVWSAYKTRRFFVLSIATLFLGVSSDDSALVAVLAASLALSLAYFNDVSREARSFWRTLAVIAVCMTLVRIGYANVPHVGTIKTEPLFANLGKLFTLFRAGGWWQWGLSSLVLPIYYENPWQPAYPSTWFAIQVVTCTLLLTAHFFFWRTAFRSPHNRLMFAAASMMLLYYGWVAGIVLARVPTFGNDYVNQPRYVLLYAGHLIALLLMWIGARDTTSPIVKWRRVTGTWLPVTGCLLILTVQIPLSVFAWHMRPYEWIYYSHMATQIDELARNPLHDTNCDVVAICGAAPEKRRELTQLLSTNRLNIYSRRVQQWHARLPALPPAPVITRLDFQDADRHR
jgi:hypothetical protein